MSAIVDLLDVLRVEVEQAPTGLQNLLANPSGDLGAWAWRTDVGLLTTGSDGGGAYLEFQSAADTTGPYSEEFPVTPGEYVAATWEAIAGDGLYVRAWVRFYDSAGVILSSTLASAWSNLVAQRFAVAPAVIPAGAVTGSLVFQVASTAAGAVPAAGKKFRYRKAIASTATTAAALGPVYTNLAANPSFQNATHGWTRKSGTGTLGIASDGAGTVFDRTSSLKVVNGSVTVQTVVQSPEVSVVTAGNLYSSGIWRSGSNGAAYVSWYTSTHAFIQTDLIGGGVTAGQTLRANMEAPGGAYYARIEYALGFGTVYLDAWHIIDGRDVPYFDGATPDTTGVDYSWTGTADLSKSLKSLSALPYIAPISYQEIQGSAVAIGIKRRAFDATLSITIRDATLDPSQANLIRPGRAVRVSALAGATWEELFQGKVQRPSVDYGDLKRKTRPTITLTAYGPGADLAASPSKWGRSGIANIPALLEGVRVPFKVNGSTAQVLAPAAVSSNDQASVLDQIILTRDSAQGYAWLTRKGVLMANSDRTLDYYGTGVATFTEGDYTGLGLDWNPDAIINQVAVILLVFNSATGETEEVTYGPYRDRASIREWGPSEVAEFRVHGAVVPATFAAAVLAANAEAQQRVNSIRVPITDTAQLTATGALLDLMAKVHIDNTDRAVDLDLRVQGVDHTITWPKGGRPKWYMDLAFTGEDQVAAPIATPPAGTSSAQEGVWNVIGAAGQPAFQNAWVDQGSFTPPGFMLENGYVHLGGVVKSGVVNSAIFTLPVGYRPARGTRMFVGQNGTGVGGRVEVTTAGVVRLFTGGSNAYLSLDGIVFKAEA